MENIILALVLFAGVNVLAFFSWRVSQKTFKRMEREFSKAIDAFEAQTFKNAEKIFKALDRDSD